MSGAYGLGEVSMVERCGLILVRVFCISMRFWRIHQSQRSCCSMFLFVSLKYIEISAESHNSFKA